MSSSFELPVKLRAGMLTDVEPAAVIWERAHEKRLGSVPGVERKAHAMAVLTSRVKLPNVKFLIAENHAGVVGMLLANQARERDGAGDPIPGLLHISYVAVDPIFWDRGIAYSLLARIAYDAGMEGYERLQLWVAANNKRARNLYEHFRFTLSGREKIEDGERIIHYVTGPLR